jgi:phosphatidylglycerophosphatase C
MTLTESSELSQPRPRPGQGVVAAFDFDGTLTKGGSVWKFLVSVANRPKVIAAALFDLPKIVRAAVLGGTANDVAKEALFLRILPGLPEDVVSKQAADFGRAHYRDRVRDDISGRLRWHLTQGHRVVIVSASPEIYIVPVADDLGASAVIATRLQVDEKGQLTGHFDGPNCRGPEKAKRLHEWIARQGDAPFVWAYGNSAGDLQMLLDADIGVNVGRLGRFGKLRGFPDLAGFTRTR